MLDTIFLQIFDMTKVASLVILIVLLVRLCLKRAPKVIAYVLWAVVLFRLLFLDHPLEGRRVAEAPCLTEELELKYYGKDPVFIYDPDDSSNRPVRGVHANVVRFWPMYPKFIRDKFAEALSKEAMSGKMPRPTDNDWQQCFTRLRDSIVTCACGEETFLTPGEDSFCINCGRKIPKPPALNCHNGKYDYFLFLDRHGNLLLIL